MGTGERHRPGSGGPDGPERADAPDGPGRQGGRGGQGGKSAPTADAGRPGFPWLWLAPGVLVLLGLVVWGAVVYPDLPDEVPQHLGTDGVDSYAAKSVGSVFLPVFVYAGVLALMTGVTVFSLRMRPESELEPGARTSPFVNRPRTRAGVRLLARAQLFLACCIGLTMGLTCLVMWSTEEVDKSPGGGFELLTLAPTAVGVLALLGAVVRDRTADRSAR